MFLPHQRRIAILHGVCAAACSNVTISGVGDLDGTYEEGCSFVYYPTTSFFSRAQDARDYAIYRSFDDWGNGFWYMVVDLNEVYRVSEP